MNRLAILVEDLNGEHAFSNERAAFGYVSPHERLIFPEKLKTKLHGITTPQQVINFTDKEMIWIMQVNYDCLRRGNISVDKAIRIAFLRARWIQQGNLLPSKKDRCTPINEVDFVKDGLDAAFLDISGAIAANSEGGLAEDTTRKEFSVAFNTIDVATWSMLAPILWACVAHVFRVRGHHFKDGYDDLYDKTFRGSTLSLPDKHLSWLDISRTAIHAFGIRALERGTAFYEEENCLTTNLLLRRDSVPCGAAIVGTTFAAVSQFQSTPWYKDFYNIYRVQIDSLVAEHEELLKNPLAYHVSAGLYGVQKLELKKSAAEALAPVLRGFIDATPKNSAIKTQKALDKHANSNPMMSELMKEWLTARISEVGDQKSLRLALGSSADSDDET